MFAEVVTDGQSARTVADEAVAAEVREALRTRAREAGVRLRTARMDDLVVAARLDATIWTDDTATMRASSRHPNPVNRTLPDPPPPRGRSRRA